MEIVVDFIVLGIVAVAAGFALIMERKDTRSSSIRRRGLRYRFLKHFGVVDYVPKLPPWHQEPAPAPKQASDRATEAHTVIYGSVGGATSAVNSPSDDWLRYNNLLAGRGVDDVKVYGRMSPSFTADEISRMSVAEYARHRAQLLREARNALAEINGDERDEL